MMPARERTRSLDMPEGISSLGTAFSSSRLHYPSRRLAKCLEWVVERLIFCAAGSAVAVIFLIFLFVTREGLPVILQTATTAKHTRVISPEEAKSTDSRALAAYLEVRPEELQAYDADTLRALLDARGDELRTAGNEPDRRINALSYRMMFFPYPWRGYDHPAFVWQPESTVPKYNVVPLLAGTLKCTVIALLFSVPLALLAAIYVSQLAPNWVRQIVKPSIEVLAGIPSVVLGFLALLVLASWMQAAFGYPSRLNALVAGVALGLAVIPIVFSISEDALRAVPNSYKEAAIALGASKLETTLRVVVPAAAPGIFAAIVLGFGRAVGETMIVLMASGNASILSLSPADSVRTITAAIAAELAETVRGGRHYQVLFFLGAALFAITFATNLAGGHFIGRLRFRMTGGRA